LFLNPASMPNLSSIKSSWCANPSSAAISRYPALRCVILTIPIILRAIRNSSRIRHSRDCRIDGA
jgi:hypothetical protein